MYNQGIKTKRILTPIRQVIANIGGITKVALPVMVFLANFFTDITHMTSKISHLSFTARDVIRAR